MKKKKTEESGSQIPDKNGYFGDFGGKFVPETLINALSELEKIYLKAKKSKEFINQYNHLLKNYAGRPTPVYYAENLSKKIKINVFLKREDLAHTGSHKLTNAIGQALLTKFTGKKRIIAETGAGQHGVASATAAALLGLECVVYMGADDVQRQSVNVKRMNLLGTKVISVDSGSKTLKDAINETLKDWVKTVKTTHYLIGSVVGPHPFPMIVRDFQSIIGYEAGAQIQRYIDINKLDYAVACVGGGSNAIGMFYGLRRQQKIKFIGVEAGGKSSKLGMNAATLTYGKPGVLHGCLTYLLQDSDGQVADVYSVSAGLDYPAVGPEHSFLKSNNIAEYVVCNDKDALNACVELSRTEGIIPALESSHALGYIIKNADKFKNKNVLVNISGRGDKDLDIIFRETGL